MPTPLLVCAPMRLAVCVPCQLLLVALWPLPHWPAALQPWIAHRAPQQGDADSEAGSELRITGLSEGARLVPVPGQPGVTVTVQARGEGTVSATVHWLVDGQVIHHSRVGESVQLRFSHDGRYRVTALDGRGHHHALSVTVSGTGSLQ